MLCLGILYRIFEMEGSVNKGLCYNKFLMYRAGKGEFFECFMKVFCTE